MAIFGWLTFKEAERYTRAAEQKKLAARAMARAGSDKAGTKVSNLCGVRLSNPIDFKENF